MATSTNIAFCVREAVDWTMDPHPVVKDQNGNVVDITGWTAVMKIRSGRSTSLFPALITLTSSSGITMGGSTGEVTVNITHTQLATLPPGVYWYDLLLTDLTGRVYCLIAGTITVDFTVSQ